MQKYFYVFLFLFVSPLSQAKIYINIGAPQSIQKSLAAVPDFRFQEDSNPVSPQQKETALSLGKQMTERLNKNLRLSGYFNIVSPKAYIEQPANLKPLPHDENIQGFRWENWKAIGVDFLFFADYFLKEDQLVVDVYFYNINLQKRILKKRYENKTNQSLSITDFISNDIVKKLSGREGIFRTKIATVRNTGRVKKELFVMDWNGENKKRISYHRSIVLSPTWSRKGDKLLYSVFVNKRKTREKSAALFLYDFKAHQTKLISSQSSSSLGADFFPGDKEILISKKTTFGLMDILKLNLRNLRFSFLTKGPKGVIHVEPDIHPKTKQIAFSSDKSGKTMIYTMSPKGRNVKQVTFAGNHNVSPDWHPYKNQIVFSGYSKGRMDLFLVSSDGTGLRRLTSLKRANGTWANCESPSFSPNGRFIVFSSDVSGTYQLYIMNVIDLSIERISFDRYNYKSPTWSPYL